MKSVEEISQAVATSLTASETLRKLGLNPYGGNHKHLLIRIRRLGLSTAHWKPNHRKTTRRAMRPLSEILIENSNYGSSNDLKGRLLAASLLEYKCATCGINEWLGSNLRLHLDHTNGVNTDNRLNNLRLLCPNCHSQTPTYCRNRKRK